MLFEFPTLVFPNDYKEDFETFYVRSTKPITKVEFVRYEDALIYLNEIIKNNDNCDNYTIDGYSTILGLQTISYVDEKNVIPYGFIPSNQGY